MTNGKILLLLANYGPQNCSNYDNIHIRYQKFQGYRFMDVELSEVSLPCKLETFCRVQHDQAEKVLKMLQKDLRRAFMEQLLGEI